MKDKYLNIDLEAVATSPLEAAEIECKRLRGKIASLQHAHAKELTSKRHIIVTLLGVTAFALIMLAMALKSNYDLMGELQRLKDIINN